MRIKELRRLSGIKQSTFAKDMNVSQATVSEWESEKISPSIDKLIAVSRYFHVSVGCVVGEEPIPADYPNHLQVKLFDLTPSEQTEEQQIPRIHSEEPPFTQEQLAYFDAFKQEILQAIREDTSLSKDQGAKQG